ncbi:hypothetical protein EUBSIR_00330 [[Eubacterium] siraeum DSM 15702]|uniref:Uncharacterized protein n=1 Tax=[Eubacterium] siraeum DSM 15702 TaxID=428128 RepID=B0MKK6_9FIRM|nr:hypothetical protein EUBSIR_00330 [[Eubacterium] siraeum DSM 15702]
MPSRHIAANAANFAYQAKQNRVSTFSAIAQQSRIFMRRNRLLTISG